MTDGKRAAGVYYEEHGTDGEKLVWLHGYGCDTSLFEKVIPHFSEYHSYVFDLPGHGESADVDADGTVVGFAGPIVAALDELELDEFTIIGYSIGGATGMRISMDHPDRVRQLIGVTPWYAAGGDKDDPTLTAFAEEWRHEDAIREVFDSMAVELPSPWTEVLVASHMKVSERCWRGFYIDGAKISQADELPNVEVPVTYILGIEDTVVDFRKSLEDIKVLKNGRGVALPGVGHLFAYEDPELLAREVRLALAASPDAAAAV